jgi:tRNA(Ile)-lysidine synthase
VTIESGRRGERLALPGHASHRPVADLLREAGIPHWERRSLPRIYVDDALAAVALLGVDVAFAATAREPAVRLAWRPRVETATRA